MVAHPPLHWHRIKTTLVLCIVFCGAIQLTSLVRFMRRSDEIRNLIANMSQYVTIIEHKNLDLQVFFLFYDNFYISFLLDQRWPHCSNLPPAFNRHQNDSYRTNGLHVGFTSGVWDENMPSKGKELLTKNHSVYYDLLMWRRWSNI